MAEIPREKALDSTLALWRNPYAFVSERCRRHRSDVFEARLLGRRTICMTGRDAAALFYDQERFERHGAAPSRIQKTLFGRGGVQALDGEPHRHRKAMFLSLMTPERIGALSETVAEQWREQARAWSQMPRVVLYDELKTLLTIAVCNWAGVPLPPDEVEQRTRELTALFDAAGGVGPRYWWSRLNRYRSDRWIENVIAGVRSGHIRPPAESAADVIANHRDLGGALLDPHVAAVELINVLRPTVAVSVFITFEALAMHEHPSYRAGLTRSGDEQVENFVQEVRRFYPFFPAAVARVHEDFDWNGYHFPAGRRALLDLYGTDHDPRQWERPDEFLPERFRDWDGDPYGFVPQGGGDHAHNHRCPGEWIAIELMKVSAPFLAGQIAYDVPAQDLRVDQRRLPALPRSGFVIQNVRRELSTVRTDTRH